MSHAQTSQEGTMGLDAAQLNQPSGDHIEAIPAGFLSWVAALVHQNRARMVAYARHLGAGPEEALDGVQDAFESFLKLPQARSLVGAPDDCSKLLTVVLRHIIWNQRSSSSRRERLLTLATLPDEDVAQPSDELIVEAERIAVMRGCIVHMDRLQRAVIELSLVDDLSGEDIAKTVGISPGYVRVLLHRARAKMRTCSAD